MFASEQGANQRYRILIIRRKLLSCNDLHSILDGAWSQSLLLAETLLAVADAEAQTGPWKCRSHAKRGTMKLSHLSQRSLEKAGAAGLSHIFPALGGDDYVLEAR